MVVPGYDVSENATTDVIMNNITVTLMHLDPVEIPHTLQYDHIIPLYEYRTPQKPTASGVLLGLNNKRVAVLR